MADQLPGIVQSEPGIFAVDCRRVGALPSLHLVLADARNITATAAADGGTAASGVGGGEASSSHHHRPRQIELIIPPELYVQQRVS